MSLLHLLSFISTFVTLIFAAAVLVRYVQRKGLHLLVWGFGLLLYAVGTFSEAYLAVAWSEFILRLWYLAGAMLVAAWLGQGTVYLLVRRPGVAHGFAALLGIASLVAVYGVFTAPVDGAAFDLAVPISGQYKDLMVRTGLTITLTILLNIYGTLALVGGAIWSAFLFWRKRVLPSRVVGNILIATGAMMPAMAGTFIKLGLADWLYLSELLGATIMFVGFLAATKRSQSEAAASTARAGA